MKKTTPRQTIRGCTWAWTWAARRCRPRWCGESGEIIGREKCPTPRKGGPERVVAAIEKCMDDMVRKGGITPGDLTAIGIAVPGVVDPDRGLVVVAPNMRLTGVDLGLAAGGPLQDAHRPRQRRQLRRVGRDLARLGPQRPTAPCISAWARASAAGWCNAASCGAATASRPARSAT